MKRFPALFLLVALTFGSTGCAELGKLIPIITRMTAAVTDAAVILDNIEEAAEMFLRSNPNHKLESAIRETIATARLALNTAIQATKGAKKLSQQEVDAAFADFREAYKILVELLGPLGVVVVDDGTLSIKRGEAPPLLVPEPMALTLKVE